MKSGKGKQRGGQCYQNKIRRIEKWYNNIVKNRQEKDGLGRIKRPLQPLEYFTDKVKKSKTQGE